MLSYMYVELYLLSNRVFVHVKDTNPTKYFLDVELSAMLSIGMLSYRASTVYIYIYIYIYIYNKIINNKIRFGNCLGEGRSRSYQVFHPFMITRRKNYIGI